MRVVSNYRQQAIFIVIIASLGALFVSRAALSISMFSLIALCCIHQDFPQQLKAFFSNYFLLGMSLLFFIPLVSGLWSEDLHEWIGVLRLKLPLFFLPLAFAGSWQLKDSQWRTIAMIFVLIVFAGSVWSALQYIGDVSAANESYLRAKVFATPLANDHVRFSWIVSIAILTIMLLRETFSGWFKWLFVFIALWLVVYLHLLAARTGLASLYIMVGYFFIRFIFLKRSLRAGLIALFVLIIMPLLAWLFVPSFQNRIRYFKYDFSYVKTGTYLPGGNDGNRFLSIRAGLDILKDHPFGVGAGDVENVVFKWYDQNVPGMVDTDRIYPSSEWLVYGLIAGWPGLVLFTAIMLLPLLLKKMRNRIFWVCLNSTAAFSFMFDVGLEVQYGIFIYAILILWWWKWLAGFDV
jgi:O-antigen ligase